MKSPCILLIIVCTLSLTGCASTKQADSDSSLGKAQQTLDSLYQHYSAKDSYLLRESYPFDEQHKVTYLASEDQANTPNQFSYLWPYSGTFSAVNALFEATHDKKYQKLLDKRVLPGLEEYFDIQRTPNAYSSYIQTAPTSDRFYDDNVWLGIDFTDTSNAGEHILGNLAKAVKDKMQENGITAEQVEGVGVGVPGPVLDSRIVPIVCANLGGWGERNVSIQLSGLLDGIKVLVGNDANVAALGEIWMGCAKGCRSAVMVTLGTGVGGGVIVNGRITEGAHGAGGEIGHITVNPHETAVCGCGKHGCLEQYSSATGVVRCMKKLLDENPDTPCTLRGTDFAAKDVFDAARAGDALAAREVDEMTDTLGMALASIASTTDPEMFMVGGGVARAGDVLFNPLREHFKTYAFSSCRETPIVAATLGNDAGIYGAVRLIVGE